MSTIDEENARVMVNDARKTFENRLEELKLNLAQEQGWGEPNSEAIASLNKNIIITQRLLENLPQVVSSND